MKKEIAIKIITSCARDYHRYLENQNLLFCLALYKIQVFLRLPFYRAIFFI